MVGIAAGYGWILKRVIKKVMTSDLSSNATDYVKFTVTFATFSCHKTIKNNKILPSY